LTLAVLLAASSYQMTPSAGGDLVRYRRPSALQLQLEGYRLSTVRILYRLPDHPTILQTFVWQHYDIAPDYPELHKFLDFWSRSIEGELHSVTVARQKLVGPSRYRSVDTVFRLH
jgi:uncharacterized protein Usg